MADPNSRESILNKNFELVKSFINTGESTALSKEAQHMLDVCVKTYGLLRKFPQRHICIKKLMALHKDEKMSYVTAARYVDFTRQTWGSYMDASKEFLESFFLDQLLSEISNPDASESIKAKNLATLQKYLESMPDKAIDPKLMEANNVYIQFNLGEKNFAMSEEMLGKLPENLRQAILQAVDNEVTEESAIEILNS